jgi:hypothetical protein
MEQFIYKILKDINKYVDIPSLITFLHKKLDMNKYGLNCINEHYMLYKINKQYGINITIEQFKEEVTDIRSLVVIIEDNLDYHIEL